MKKVCVITGGGSGMGLEAGLQMDREKIIVVSGRTEKKLENAVMRLSQAGFEAYARTCDTSKRESVRQLAEYAESLGGNKECHPRGGSIAGDEYYSRRDNAY